MFAVLSGRGSVPRVKFALEIRSVCKERERSQKGEGKKYGKKVILQKRKKEYFFLYLDVKDLRPSGSH